MFVKPSSLFPDQAHKHLENGPTELYDDVTVIKIIQDNIIDLVFDLYDGYWGSLRMPTDHEQTVLPTNIPLDVLDQIRQSFIKHAHQLKPRLWTGTGSMNFPNYMMVKAQANFNPQSLDIIERLNINGRIEMHVQELEKSTNIREFDNKQLRNEMIRSLFRGGYLTIENFEGRHQEIAELKVTNKACYDSLSQFKMNFYLVKQLSEKISNCLQQRAKFNQLNIQDHVLALNSCIRAIKSKYPKYYSKEEEDPKVVYEHLLVSDIVESLTLNLLDISVKGRAPQLKEGTTKGAKEPDVTLRSNDPKFDKKVFFELAYANRNINTTKEFKDHAGRSYTSIPNCLGMVVFEISRTDYNVTRAVGIDTNRKVIGFYSVANAYGGKNEDDLCEVFRKGEIYAVTKQ